MKGFGKIVGLVAIAMVVGVGATSAQDTDRRERERRLRELREEVRNLERELGVSAWHGGALLDVPRMLSLSTNRAQLGVYVKLEADDETDAIGAVLSGVETGGPAEKAGLREGDIIVSFDGEPLAGRYPAAGRDESEPGKKLIDLVGDLDPGDEVRIQYRRGNDTFTTTATLEPRGNEFAFGFSTPGGSAPWIAGTPGANVRPRVEVRSVGPQGNIFTLVRDGIWGDMELVALNEGLGRYFGTSEGLLVIKAPTASNVDLQAGDVILSIDGREASTPSRALRILQSYEEGETAAVQIVRDRNRMTVQVTIPGWDRRDHFERGRLR